MVRLFLMEVLMKNKIELVWLFFEILIYALFVIIVTAGVSLAVSSPLIAILLIVLIYSK